MTAPTSKPEQARTPLLGAIGLGVLAVPVGLYGAVFGVLAWALGPIVAVVGARSPRGATRRWVLLSIGVGLTLGAAWYIGSGILQPDGPSKCTSDDVVCTGSA